MHCGLPSNAPSSSKLERTATLGRIAIFLDSSKSLSYKVARMSHHGASSEAASKHEMQPIVTDDRGVCQSVCLSATRVNLTLLCKTGWTDRNAVWSEHSWGDMEHSVRRGGGPDPPQRGEGNRILNFGTPLISETATAKNLNFFAHIEGWGPNENYAKVGHGGRGGVT